MLHSPAKSGAIFLVERSSTASGMSSVLLKRDQGRETVPIESLLRPQVVVKVISYLTRQIQSFHLNQMSGSNVAKTIKNKAKG